MGYSGFGIGEYCSIDEATARENCEEVYNAGANIDEGVDAIFEAGTWKEPDDDDFDDDDFDDEE